MSGRAAGPILTVTPNPSLDLLFTAERLVWDDANRLDAPRRRAGGQGINLVRAAHAIGGSAVPIALLGGRVGDELRDMLLAENAGLIPVPITGETRLFVGVRVLDGPSLLLNPRGPECDEGDERRLLDAVRDALRRLEPGWVACCGSVPPGISERCYAMIGELARAAGARFVADCDGELLRLARPHCDLLVPNAHEAGRLLGREIDGIEDAATAAAELCEGGSGIVAITLGDAGAVAAASGGGPVWHAAVPPQPDGSAVGAGDAFLAALLLGLEAGDALPDALRSAVAAGSAVLRSTGGALLERLDYREVQAEVEVRRV
jgi:1-phosphofructokinase